RIRALALALVRPRGLELLRVRRETARLLAVVAEVRLPHVGGHRDVETVPTGARRVPRLLWTSRFVEHRLLVPRAGRARIARERPRRVVVAALDRARLVAARAPHDDRVQLVEPSAKSTPGRLC